MLLPIRVCEAPPGSAATRALSALRRQAANQAATTRMSVCPLCGATSSRCMECVGEGPCTGRLSRQRQRASSGSSGRARWRRQRSVVMPTGHVGNPLVADETPDPIPVHRENIRVHVRSGAKAPAEIGAEQGMQERHAVLAR